MQKLVSQYSSEPFEVAVEFVESQGMEYPVMVVPTGITVPVAIKADLVDGSRSLLKCGEVPFRTLRANGTFSSAAALPQDWKEIVEICFENREADIGRFVRRQLGGLTPEMLHSLGAALSTASGTSEDSLKSQALSLLEFGFERSHKILAERGLAAGAEDAARQWGTWEVALVVAPALDEAVPTREFYSALVSNNPQYTAWPPWQDTRSAVDPFARATVREGGWESLTVAIGSASYPLDLWAFSRLDPQGRLYELRALDDDAFARARGAPPQTAFDPGHVVHRVAETMLVGLRYARILHPDSPGVGLGFAFGWKGLKKRAIVSWSGQVAVLPGIYRTLENEDTSFVAVPIDTAESAIAPFVQKAVKSVFARFDGYSMGISVIEHLVRQLIERRIA